MSAAIGLAGEAAEVLRQQDRRDMAAAVETLRTAAIVRTGETLSPTQFARLTGMHRNTVRNWANAGWIRSARVGRRGDIRIPRSEAERFLKIERELEAGIGWPTERQVREYMAMREGRWTRPKS